ncbi:MAG TPA: TonB-dependent receptor plug domain-containing protein, partial [Syntrophorhabdaceae bacterium]|nr:TonB-dependent receptor plug domain-containing protein [Syntrophorhabdaceae bacterium]
MSKHLLKNAIQALLTIICLLSSTLGLWAQETQAPATKERHIFTLGEIEVKDSSELNKNVTVDTINGEQIREFNANRLPNALDLIPGVTVTGGGRRNEKGIFVRGFSTSRVPVFLDGIPIYVPYDRTFDFDRFTTFDLSEIVVSKGFTSVLYGPNTMGGAINMVSRKPVKSFEGDVGAGYGSGDTYYGYTNVGTNQKKWYLEAGASDYNRDYYPMSNKFDPTSIQARGQRIESYSKDYKVNFKVGFTPAEGHEYALGYIQQHGEKGDPPDVRSASAGGDTKYWLWPRWDKTTTYLTTDTPIMD